MTPLGRETSAGSLGLDGFINNTYDELGQLHYYTHYDTDVEATRQIIGGLHP